MSWQVLYTRSAQRDVKIIRKSRPDLVARMNAIDAQLRSDPLAQTQRMEALCGNLKGYYSRRLDGFHRVIYRLEAPDVVVVSCLGHYGDG